MAKTYDFAGYVTKNNIRCADGVIIRRDAFKDQDGATVPFVWQHNHKDPEAVIGHAVLENRPDGVYGYVKLNDSEAGRAAKVIVNSGDVASMSIWANNLERAGAGRKDIIHGIIREVSLVLSGANPGALIEQTNVVHGADEDWDEGIIYTDGVVLADDNPAEIEHSADKADEEKKTEKAESEDKRQTAENQKTSESEESKMAEDKSEKKQSSDEKTVGDVIETMTEEQKNVMYYMVGQALEEAAEKAENNKKDDEDETDEEDDKVKHNAFDDAKRSSGYYNEGDVLSHDAMTEILNDAKRLGSLQESLRQHDAENITVIAHDSISHSQDYGMVNTDYLYPDYRSVTAAPTFVSRNMEWVDSVINNVHRAPFARIKSVHADITAEDARARGYLKGKLKKDEVFTLLKRTTDPQTIYKKQRIDRDDLADITDFDVVAMLKNEMKMMLNEEIGRDILVGDGRLTSSDDHVDESHVRPIWTDSDLYTIKYAVEVNGSTTDEAKAKAIIKGSVKARANYKGSGNPTMFTTDAVLTDMMLLEDGVGRPLYNDMNALMAKLRVSKIVTVPVMEGLTRTSSDGATKYTLAAIIVNPRDYTIGLDKLGATSMFEDFDIDYNQMKYLIETRLSGAMTVPYGAIAVELSEAVTSSGD